MKKTILMGMLFFGMSLYSQQFLWSTGDGGYNEDRGLSVAADASGNVYVTGFFKSSATFGSTTFTSAGVEDIFLAKYDPAGTLIWAKQFGGPSIDKGFAVDVDAAGNCYLAGEFRGPVTFGSYTLESTTVQDYEAFVLKTDSTGNVLWARKGGGAGVDEAYGVAVTNDRVIVTGEFAETASFAPFTVSSSGYGDVFVASYDLEGNIQWITTGGGAQADQPWDIDTDAAGNAYVAGYFQGAQATFGNTTLGSGLANWFVDMFVFKIDPSGNIVWAHSGGTASNDDGGRDIAVDGDGNVYVAGDIRDSGQFDSIVYDNAGIADIFVAKYNSNGVIQFLKQIGSDAGDYAYAVDSYGGSVFITGLFHSTVQMGATTLTSAGNNDIYVASLDAASGDVTGAIRAGGLGDDAGRGICAGNMGIFATGDFEHSPSTFPPFSLDSNGTHDVFVGRISIGNLGIKTLEYQNFIIAQNPVLNTLELRSSDHMAGSHAEILSVDGKIIQTFKISGGYQKIDVSTLSAGIFILRSTSDVMTSVKFIKK